MCAEDLAINLGDEAPALAGLKPGTVVGLPEGDHG